MNLFKKTPPKPAEDPAGPKIGSTQQHIPVKAIHDDVVILKDGSVAVILQTTAVNFDLLSENEQLAIISSFAALINSLSFSIQIVISSKRLDISKYLANISKIELAQTNPLLKQMTKRYRIFVETLTSENEVLDKQFFVVVPVSYLEIGMINNIEQNFQKALTLLIPRRDNVIKMLSRIGLKANQLTNDRLIRLFYDVYNESTLEKDVRAFIDKTVALKAPVAPPSTVEDHKPPAAVKPTQKAEETAKIETPKLAEQEKIKQTEAAKHAQEQATKHVQDQATKHAQEQEVRIVSMESPRFDDLNLKTRENQWKQDLTSYHTPYSNSPQDQTNRPSTPFVVEELEDN